MRMEQYTDSAVMRPLLQSQLPGFADGRLRIDALDVHGVRRNTSHAHNPFPMTLCYRLQVSDTLQGRAGEQTLFAQVLRPGRADDALTQRPCRTLARPAFGEPRVHLPALDLLLWALPNDPGLPQLATLLDPRRARQALPAAFSGGRLVDLQVELLRYTPQQRATLRYTLTSAGGAAPCTLYAKTFDDQRAVDIDARFGHFWRLAQHDADAPQVARPLGVDRATRSAWQAPAVGVPLLPLLASPHGPALIRRVAHALAVLHAAPLATSAPPRTVDHWLAETRRRQKKIARIDAVLGARAARIADAIEAGAAGRATRPLGVIHGDCHPEQFWAHDGRVVLFDLDELTAGDPMEDLAEFALKLEQAGVGRQVAHALFAHYAADAPERFDAGSLAWHLAIQGLLQVSRAFVYQQPGWAAELERRLAAAEARAAALSATELA